MVSVVAARLSRSEHRSYAMIEAYGEQLTAIAGILPRAGIAPSVRGEGAARFVFAQHADRAVEIDCDDSTGWIIEMFENPADASVDLARAESLEHAAAIAAAWLSRQQDRQ